MFGAYLNVTSTGGTLVQAPELRTALLGLCFSGSKGLVFGLNAIKLLNVDD